MNSLSDSDRAFIMECAQEAIDYNWELADQSEEEILKQLEDAGFPVNDVDISVRETAGREKSTRPLRAILSPTAERIRITC